MVNQISPSQVFKAMQVAGFVSAFAVTVEVGDWVIITSPNKAIRSGLAVAVDQDANAALVLISRRGELKARWVKLPYLSVGSKRAVSTVEAQALSGQAALFF